MSQVANRYAITKSMNAHLYWEDYELVLDMRCTPIECIFFLEDCIIHDAIFRENPKYKCYNLFVDILWEVFREKTSITVDNLRSLVNCLQGWYWSECDSDQDIEDRWLGQEQLGQLLLQYPTIFDSSWVERNFFKK